MNTEKARKDLEKIFAHAVESVKPETILRDQLFLSGSTLTIKTPLLEKNIDLSPYKRIWVTGAGKATASMAKALESVLGEKIEKGIISVKYGHTEKLSRITIIESGHPMPDQNSARAAREISALAGEADTETFVINLISGGGSALLSCPYEGEGHTLFLEEKQAVTKLLLECGAAIEEINCIRKHISGIKGGRLAKLLYPAASISLILSDVVGDALDTIASGLTVPDTTTWNEAFAILEKYSLIEKVPASVKKLFIAGKSGQVSDTPKKGDRVFDKTENFLIGTNRLALIAAEKKALELGYNTIVLSSGVTGEAREIAKFYSALGRDSRLYNSPVPKPACIIAGGETTVTIRGKGRGGRNQEMALAFINEIKNCPSSFSGVSFLSGGTDGSDGPTDAAGAFASEDILVKGTSMGLSPALSLADNDSYNYFRQAGGLLITGPTNTNVCDIQLLLIS